MKLIFQTLISLITSGLFLSCGETEIKREYPRLETLEVTNISVDGAKFSAEITSNNNFEILNYGFVWQPNGRSPKINSVSSIINFSGDLQSNSFSAEVEEPLSQGTTYYARAYVETEDFIVYAPSVPFRVN